MKTQYLLGQQPNRIYFYYAYLVSYVALFILVVVSYFASPRAPKELADNSREREAEQRGNAGMVEMTTLIPGAEDEEELAVDGDTVILPNLEIQSNIFSRLTFGWLTPTLWVPEPPSTPPRVLWDEDDCPYPCLTRNCFPGWCQAASGDVGRLRCGPGHPIPERVS
jgi:hypothetical protein